ncbi:MAG: AAA family ATPase [Planctomycetaceae bacterium]
MDPRRNPYAPGAGAEPPALVGRDRELEAFDILLARLRAARPEQSLLVTGRRGVGKTVLLGAFEQRARAEGWVTVDSEIRRDVAFGPRMAQLARRALLETAPKSRWRERARRAARVLRSFSLTVSTDGSVTGSLDVEPLDGVADSGDLSDDMTDLLVAIGEAAHEHGTGVVFLLDEVQFLSRVELEALIAALHKVVQRRLPVAIVGAGLPHLPRLAGEAKSYAERLFRYPTLGRLDRGDAEQALTLPAAELGVAFEPRAIDTVVAFTEGYPYFIQEYGKVLWDRADGTPITAVEAVEAQALVEARLDESFFRVRIERVSELEVRYLRAMAELGPDPQRASDVAAVLGRSADQLGQIRSRLIDKGLLYTPSYGRAAFTVPQFDRFMRRTYPRPAR